MAITGKTFADGELPNTKTPLFTATLISLVRFFRLVNTDSAVRTVNVFVTRAGGGSRHIIEKDLQLAAAGSAGSMKDVLVDQLLTLSIGDAIEGQADTAAKVEYFISGGV